MPRTPIVAGNWKMNTTADSAIELARALREALAEADDASGGIEKVVCPPFVFLGAVAKACEGSPVKVGAQNMHWEEKGAFTGEVSAAMLAGLAEYVIIGHSERRQYFCETDETVSKKLRAAVAAGLKPIVCVGETGAQRQAGETKAVLRRQVRGAFEGQPAVPPETTVVAYEPVWAIGTGVAATPSDAQEAIAFIRGELADIVGAEAASQVRILYGGSVTPDNIADFVAQPDVDGGLVGGASLVAASFVEMVRKVAAIGR
ncbi:MAG TPA: triose-phosphate isomerase [Dehalococcoidia bacterium]|nr:triose-phosphate isomerase [Dehalococcoidia bacterium]